ncbi:4-alpha-glucanotransferase [Nocardioides hwasunensis]|uniref:4-alpha-glucanotransferase n=1 Tax=Nocardioides hwasunensis TaxID=397258 RepID=A0ABR8MKK4_9ACTN|nr:4-alpha-glucanotransferase [Nocardioides hwasunensis]MBD3916557.1 4-alpha-glucanotransferase [Nocardioides hwasunensis]
MAASSGIPERAAGVQLHITSLPGGRLGEPARDFVRWLADAGQSVWQVLPLTVPDEHGSPYASPSAFAAWSGLLEDPAAVVSDTEVAAYADDHAYWAGSWSAHGGDLADQVRFEREWGALRSFAADHGVQVLGDIPIYVAAGSADASAWPQLFRDDAVAGVPPDAYSDTGQLWGNPLYDWKAMEADGYRWWVERLRRSLELYDLVRVDHFRGFAACWAVPADHDTAEDGTWEPGPGRAVFDAAAAELGPLPVVAEDLGVIDEPVRRLRSALGLPGMAVLQFAFDPDGEDRSHEPENLHHDQVVYTGTHDNDTVVGWWDGLPERRRRAARRAWQTAGIDDADPAWAMIRLAHSTPCRVAMVQAQDVLSLGADARMNTPGTAATWSWQLGPGMLTADLARRLREVSEASGRLG